MSDLTFERRGLQVYDCRTPRPFDGKADRAVRSTLHRRTAALTARAGPLFVPAVLALGHRLASATDEELDTHVSRLAAALRTRRVSSLTGRAEAYAAIREISRRTLGLSHYAVQIRAARAMDLGAIAEMQTGEGKTLTATLTAGAAALAGRRVHVMTANDYLARRDLEWMRPIYQRLGLTAAVILPDIDEDARRRAYRSDIVYAAGKDIAFDFLRDRVAMGSTTGDARLRLTDYLTPLNLRLPGLDMALVDEADSVMIDEARTPLILSSSPASAEEEAEVARVARRLAEALKDRRDFRLDATRRTVDLTPAGQDFIEARASELPEGWRARPIREEIMRTAIAAEHFHARGDHYIVADGKVQIVDEYTGRILPDRSWSAGLHQAVEAKEGVKITDRRETLAQTTFQRFLRRYHHLCGMTGTAVEAAGEFWSVYDCPVVRIPPRRRNRRRHLKTRIFRTEAEKWSAVAKETARMRKKGSPVLIGTRTIAASDAASRALHAHGIPHRVLSATEIAAEAEIIAEAGRTGAVTVATNMAGRGTDILLDDPARDAGGLHVILTERHSARRIDRQLHGRSGRQGDPGSIRALLSLEDSILQDVSVSGRFRTARSFGGERAFDRAQAAAERRHARARARLLELDEKLAEQLAFAGKSE